MDKSTETAPTQAEIERVLRHLASKRTPAKAAASRKNGKLGGRPRKVKAAAEVAP